MAANNKTIDLVDLEVNTENYRFEPMASQKEAIDRMIENQGEKLYNLAKDIITYGLSPIEMVLVAPTSKDKTKFNVLEGNRRVIALKLTSNPDLIEDPARSTLKTKFRKLHEDNRNKLVKKIDCIVCDTPTEADKWIKLKHAGESDGVGTVSWNAQQIARFEEKVENKSSLALQVIKLLQNSPDVSPQIKAKLNSLSTTNVDRLVSDPDVRNILGFDVTNGVIQSSVSEKEVIKGLIQVAQDLLDPSFTVKKIYTKENRADYIKHFNSNSKPDLTAKATKPWSVSSTTTPQPTTASKPYPAYRRVLIPKKCVIKIKNPKVNKRYHEFQKLNVDNFTNATAVMFRVFVESSVDCYLKEHNIPTKDKMGFYLKLKDKTSKVIDDLEGKKLIEKEECKGIRSEVNDKDGILGLDTLHAYVHNPNFSPHPRNLTTAWDNIEPFMKAVLKNT